MAITVNGTPKGGASFTMAYNPVEYDVSSDNTTQENFKYIADLYWAGATAPIRYTQGAEPTNGYCHFDFSSVLKTRVSNNPPITSGSTFFHASDSYINFTVKFGEQYGASSAIVNYTNLTTATNTIWNASLPQNTYWNGTSPTSRYIIGSSSKKFLTAAPRTTSAVTGLKIGTNEQFYLYFLQSSAGSDIAYNAVIKTYTSAGVLIQTVKYGTDYTSAAKMQYVACGTTNFTNLTGAETRFSASVGLPVITASTAYYETYIEDATNRQITEAFRLYVEDECGWETPYRLCFLNRYGGYDFFTFYWNHKSTVTYQKSTMMAKSWAWSGNASVYNPYQRGKTQYNTIASDKLTLNSGWITEDMSTWLEDLVSSPDVYILDNTNQLIAVNVINNSYEYKTNAYDNLANLTIDLELNYNRYRQQA